MVSFLLIVGSFLLVAFGQPAWVAPLGLIAAGCGHALFWKANLAFATRRQRFWSATAWFTAVQLVQLSWFLSHPYSYIYFLHALLSFLMGLQYGCLAFFITKERIKETFLLFGVAGFWTLMEWLRLFVLSGFTWNPVGLALSGSLIPMQFASLFGVFGLSFLVMLTNMAFLRLWMTKRGAALWIGCLILPYLYGAIHYGWHANKMEEENRHLSAVLVQTAFPAEEALGLTKEEFLAFVLQEWKTILTLLSPQQGKEIDLTVLPEFVVPYGTYTFIYPFERVKQLFIEVYGEEVVASFPPMEIPFAVETEGKYDVDNAFFCQTIANYFSSPLLVGLEDAEITPEGERHYYSGALYFQPLNNQVVDIQRYEKRVLVPMGEYIPFSFCRALAASYGIGGSFTCGKEAKVFSCAAGSFGVSICYEETFGDLMRESRINGGQMLVNLTSDVWYPDSRLTWQHLEHARLRTVENGVPLIRACNTGITSAIDSLGRLVDALPEYDEEGNWFSGSLYVRVPTYTYSTLYSLVGDTPIIALSLLMFLGYLIRRRQSNVID